VKTRTPCAIVCGGKRIDVSIAPAFQLCAKCERAYGDYRGLSPTPIETDDARFDAWSAYLERWSLRYPCRLVLRCEREQTAGGYYLRIAFLYPDERDSNDSISPPPPTTGIWPPSLYPDDDTPRWLRQNVIYHLVHELDEHLLLDGVRVFDPHADAIYYCKECEAKL
jgi:hypothetical protein